MSNLLTNNQEHNCLEPYVFASKKNPPNYLFQLILCIVFTLTFTISNVNARGGSELSSPEDMTDPPERVILNQAQSLSPKDQNIRIELANKALQLATTNYNDLVIADAHFLLGTLFLEQQENSVNLSKFSKINEHFRQASTIYKRLNDTEKYILASISYANSLVDNNRYNEMYNIIDDVLPVALQHGDDFSIAATLLVKANALYDQKKFVEANAQYVKAVKYLSGDDLHVKEQLASTYKKIAQSHKRLKNRKQTAFYYKKSLELYTDLQNLQEIARALSYLAEAERYLGNYVVALDYSIQGLKLHSQLDDPLGRAKASMGVGIIYRHIGRFENSLQYMHEAYLYYEEVNDSNGIAKTSNQIGHIYTRLKQFEQAKSFYQVTVDQPQELVDAPTLGSALKELAVINLNANNFDIAINLAKRAHEIYRKLNDKAKTSSTARIIGNIYRDQKDFTNAAVYYRKSLEMAVKIENKIYQVKALTPLGQSLITTDPVEATRLLKEALALSIEIDSKSQQLYAYRGLKQAQKAQGDIERALYNSEKETDLILLIESEKDYKDLALAKANLHSHKMEMELESLREKTKLDQLELAKKNSEIEIAGQARIISELELVKNRYASFALSSLLIICVIAVIYIYRRFSYTRQRNKELDYLAARDPLTNCYNRRVLFDQMNRDFEKIELLGEYCIIMADIDHFKSVNDTYGHSVGDTVLRTIANILKNSVRQNDITARFGGEEFCIVLPNTILNQALQIAESMRQKIESTHFDKVKVTCSFGVTSIKFDAKVPGELIKQADLALYESKHNGRNQVTLWDKNLENK